MTIIQKQIYLSVEANLDVATGAITFMAASEGNDPTQCNVFTETEDDFDSYELPESEFPFYDKMLEALNSALNAYNMANA